jgi:3',5'-cyclic AMP phosphodiesterase CpdA
LLAISDLHVAFPENRRVVADLRPEAPDDWLLVAGDVGELVADVEWALTLLAQRFSKVIWVPGNHELWTPQQDPLQLRGENRYGHLVQMCRRTGVVTPEDPLPVWEGPGGPIRVAPLFLLYDYTFRPEGTVTQQDALARAYDSGVVCNDEFLLHPDPYPSREAWCRARLEVTERRLAACGPDIPMVLVNHFPTVREPTRALRHPEFALWCGSERTANWHRRFPVTAVVYGHLHIPRTTWHDGVRFEEVSLGYPRERRHHGSDRNPLRRIIPAKSFR